MTSKQRPYPIEDDDESDDEFALAPDWADPEFATGSSSSFADSNELDGTPPDDLTAEQAAGENADGTALSESDEPLLDKSERTWLTRLSNGVASTGRFIYDIPGNLGVTRPSMPQLRGAIPDPPLGARQVSHGYADDLWQARPTLDRPYPVVLIHGTISSKNVWQNLVLRLRNDGFVVFSPDYGVHGTQDIPTSAQDIGAYIEQVLSATGAEAVDIVGHSQGGLLARYWINELGGEDYVHHLISLGSPHQGTTLLGMLGNLLTSETTQRMAAATIRRVFGAAGMQQIIGSPVLETLAASPDTRPMIRYTNYATRNDSTVVPHENAFLSMEDSDLVKNVFVQDVGVGKCRHEELPSNPAVQELVHETLVQALRDDEGQEEEWDS